MHLGDSERLRYSRHLFLSELGEEGQKKLKASRVLVIGVGGLGSAVSSSLAAAGIGELTLVDDDRVSLSNLQRQLIYSTQDVGRPKVYAARDRLLALNPGVRILAREERFHRKNAQILVRDHDLVLDCTDRFGVRFCINDACVLAGKPWIYAAASGFDARAGLFAPEGPCLRCLHPLPPVGVSDCGRDGVLAPLPTLVGALQASEAIKWLAGMGSSLQGKLWVWDAFELQAQVVAVPRVADCPTCGPSGRGARAAEEGPDLVFGEEEAGACDANRSWLFDLRSEQEFERAHLAGARRVDPNRIREVLMELGQDEPIVFCCQSGRLSGEAVVLAQDLGMRRVSHLPGGLSACNGDSGFA